MKRNELLDNLRDAIQNDCTTIAEEMQDCTEEPCLNTVCAAVERMRTLIASYAVISRLSEECPRCGYPR